MYQGVTALGTGVVSPRKGLPQTCAPPPPLPPKRHQTALKPSMHSSLLTHRLPATLCKARLCMVQPSYRWDLQGLYCLSAVTVSLLHAHARRGLFLHGWPDDIQVGLCQQAAKMYALMSVEPGNTYRQLQFATWAGHFAIFDQVRAAETVGAMCRHNGPSRGHGPAMTRP